MKFLKLLWKGFLDFLEYWEIITYPEPPKEKDAPVDQFVRQAVSVCYDALDYYNKIVRNVHTTTGGNCPEWIKLEEYPDLSSMASCEHYMEALLRKTESTLEFLNSYIHRRDEETRFQRETLATKRDTVKAMCVTAGQLTAEGNDAQDDGNQRAIADSQ